MLTLCLRVPYLAVFRWLNIVFFVQSLPPRLSYSPRSSGHPLAQNPCLPVGSRCQTRLARNAAALRRRSNGAWWSNGPAALPPLRPLAATAAALPPPLVEWDDLLVEMAGMVRTE